MMVQFASFEKVGDFLRFSNSQPDASEAFEPAGGAGHTLLYESSPPSISPHSDRHIPASCIGSWLAVHMAENQRGLSWSAGGSRPRLLQKLAEFSSKTDMSTTSERA